MSSRRYTERESAEIIRKAAESQLGNFQSGQEGVSEEELRAAAGELGIDSKALDAALQAHQASVPSRKRGFFGGPFFHEAELVFEGSMSAEQWEEILPDIRRTYGEAGKVEMRGLTYEWTSTGSGAPLRMVTIRQSGGTIRIKASTDLTNFAQGLYTVLIVPIFMIAGLTTKLNLGPTLLALLVTFIPICLFLALRSLVVTAAIRQASDLNSLVDRVRGQLESSVDNASGSLTNTTEESPTIQSSR